MTDSPTSAYGVLLVLLLHWCEVKDEKCTSGSSPVCFVAFAQLQILELTPLSLAKLSQAFNMSVVSVEYEVVINTNILLVLLMLSFHGTVAGGRGSVANCYQPRTFGVLQMSCIKTELWVPLHVNF